MKKNYKINVLQILRNGRLLVLILFLSFFQYANAQKPPHLVPITITDMVPVEIDFEKECQQSFYLPDTNYIFTECRNAEGTVGYLLEPKECSYLSWGARCRQFEDCCEAGMKEVQRAETIFAKVMDKRADAAQEINRVFTAPYFYQYIRQYAFYLNQYGDTCVHINCIHISEVMPELRFFHFRERPDLHYISYFDGDDNFWNVDLNLSQVKLFDFSINGPTINIVEGRNDEPRGLYQETLFRDILWPIQENNSYDQLPVAVKEAVSSQIDTNGITDCEYFSSKYIWTCREKKNGDWVSRRKRYKKGDYYRICSDSICRGYDAKGRLLYVGNREYLGRLEPKYLIHIAEIDMLMSAIKCDMIARGYDYEKYGYIQWVEQVGDYYVLAVIYNPPIPADFLYVYYTLDDKGQIKGVYLEQR